MENNEEPGCDVAEKKYCVQEAEEGAHRIFFAWNLFLFSQRFERSESAFSFPDKERYQRVDLYFTISSIESQVFSRVQ